MTPLAQNRNCNREISTVCLQALHCPKMLYLLFVSQSLHSLLNVIPLAHTFLSHALSFCHISGLYVQTQPSTYVCTHTCIHTLTASVHSLLHSAVKIGEIPEFNTGFVHDIQACTRLCEKNMSEINLKEKKKNDCYKATR